MQCVTNHYRSVFAENYGGSHATPGIVRARVVHGCKCMEEDDNWGKHRAHGVNTPVAAQAASYCAHRALPELFLVIEIHSEIPYSSRVATAESSRDCTFCKRAGPTPRDIGADFNVRTGAASRVESSVRRWPRRFLAGVPDGGD